MLAIDAWVKDMVARTTEQDKKIVRLRGKVRLSTEH